ncbi:MAG: DUF4743 domain-containing protein [SAR324 cluster bacterium]|nr:DUF4743 domain-containing protein [SAR324 cluster bacterium]
MSFLKWIQVCNTYDISQFIPFNVAEQPVGWIKKAKLSYLEPYPEVFQVHTNQVVLHPQLDSLETRTQAVAEMLEAWRSQQLLPGWYNEQYPVSLSHDDPPLFLIERGAISFFGIRASGVHLNGFCYKAGQLFMWVGRRSASMQAYPNLLDNLVAGGKPYNLGIQENIIKECKEEANISSSLAKQAKPVGAIHYCIEVPGGLRRDTIYNYDLELPESFSPVNTDGEFENFYLWPIEKVIDKVANTKEFKTNCNLVIIDFLVRHGLLTPDTPNYTKIVEGLHPLLP